MSESLEHNRTPESQELSVTQLASLAEFYLDKFDKAAAETTSKASARTMGRKADEMRLVLEKLQWAQQNGFDTSDAEERMNSAAELSDDPAFDATFEFISTNKDKGLNRADYKRWIAEKASQEETRARSEQAKDVKAEQAVRRAEAGDIKAMREKITGASESPEKLIEEIARAIRTSGSIILSASLPRESWKAGGVQRPNNGSATAVAGKHLVGANPSDRRLRRVGFDQAPSPHKVGIKDVAQGWLTYNLAAVPGFKTVPTTESYTVPAEGFMGKLGRTVEKTRTVNKRVPSGAPAKMSDHVADGGNEEAFTLSFKRRGKCWDGRPTETSVTTIIPKSVAEKAHQLLSKFPMKADELFDAILPDWAKDKKSKLSHFPVQEVKGNLPDSL